MRDQNESILSNIYIYYIYIYNGREGGRRRHPVSTACPESRSGECKKILQVEVQQILPYVVTEENESDGTHPASKKKNGTVPSLAVMPAPIRFP